MGTRSTIALEYADGTVGQIYCHWDGYLAHNGEILATNYTDPFKVRDLLDNGDMSSLGAEIGEGRPFTNPNTYGSKEYDDFEQQYEGQCVFYKYRGENCPQRLYATVDQYFNQCQHEEYDYILRRDGAWYVFREGTDSKWIPLKEAMAACYKI